MEIGHRKTSTFVSTASASKEGEAAFTALLPRCAESLLAALTEAQRAMAPLQDTGDFIGRALHINLIHSSPFVLSGFSPAERVACKS